MKAVESDELTTAEAPNTTVAVERVVETPVVAETRFRVTVAVPAVAEENLTVTPSEAAVLPPAVSAATVALTPV
jgi:hypothetical protein